MKDQGLVRPTSPYDDPSFPLLTEPLGDTSLSSAGGSISTISEAQLTCPFVSGLLCHPAHRQVESIKHIAPVLGAPI